MRSLQHHGRCRPLVSALRVRVIAALCAYGQVGFDVTSNGVQDFHAFFQDFQAGTDSFTLLDGNAGRTRTGFWAEPDFGRYYTSANGGGAGSVVGYMAVQVAVMKVEGSEQFAALNVPQSSVNQLFLMCPHEGISTHSDCAQHGHEVISLSNGNCLKLNGIVDHNDHGTGHQIAGVHYGLWGSQYEVCDTAH